MAQEIFSDLLIQAVEYDRKNKMNEALTCYKEGIALLIKYMKGVNDQTKLIHYQSKVSEYLKRAEDIKEFLKRKDELGDHVHIDIKNNDTNYSYKSILSRFTGPLVQYVKINDPYIRQKYHAINLLKFIEALIGGCKNLKKVELLTSKDQKESQAQISNLKNIQNNLNQFYNISFSFTFSETLHDRSIVLSNGWCIKIGRGLDYFHHCDSWTPGYFDLDLRPCRETSIDYFYQPESENE